MNIYGVEYSDQEIEEASSCLSNERLKEIANGDLPSETEDLHFLLCDICMERSLSGE